MPMRGPLYLQSRRSTGQAPPGERPGTASASRPEMLTIRRPSCASGMSSPVKMQSARRCAAARSRIRRAGHATYRFCQRAVASASVPQISSAFGTRRSASCTRWPRLSTTRSSSSPRHGAVKPSSPAAARSPRRNYAGPCGSGSSSRFATENLPSTRPLQKA